jgi:DNA-directed RNA polymerase specialized sigma24 family protein
MAVLRAQSLSLTAALVHSTAHSLAESAPADARALRLSSHMVQGDRQALAELFEWRIELVEAQAWRSLGAHHALAPDAAQEAWLRVARAPVVCSTLPALDSWLRRVTASAAVDLLRADLARKVRERRVARSRQEACAFLQDAAHLESARAVLAELSPTDRSLLELRARTESTFVQLARAVGLGPAALESRLRRAIKRAERVAQEIEP